MRVPTCAWLAAYSESVRVRMRVRARPHLRLVGRILGVVADDGGPRGGLVFGEPEQRLAHGGELACEGAGAWAVLSAGGAAAARRRRAAQRRGGSAFDGLARLPVLFEPTSAPRKSGWAARSSTGP